MVSNDLQHDQRVRKVCDTLLELNYNVLLVGRKLASSEELNRPYPTKRLRLFFTKGALFYAALNVRFFFFLLFRKTDVILANDLDTLLPAFLISKLKRVDLVYDSHEYFTEAEGLTGRGFQKSVWLCIEKWIFPTLKKVYTVNESIASIYHKLYNVDVKIIRNIPVLNPLVDVRSRSELGLPENKKIILLQGAFIDPDRGGVELIEAMSSLEDILLLIIGSGRDIDHLKSLVVKWNLEEKVKIYGKMPFDELRQYTLNVDLGLSLDKPLHLNYTLSLPNKLFDYIHAGIPVLVSDLPELRRIVVDFGVGMVVNTVEPQSLAIAIKTALHHQDYFLWRQNCILAREQLNWRNEEKVLREIYG